MQIKSNFDIHNFIKNSCSNITFQNGFWDLTQENEPVAWNDEMSNILEDTKGDHFIDIFNRSLVIDNLITKLQQDNCNYIDIGCSAGFLLKEIKAKFPNLIISGADTSEASLMIAQKRLPYIPFFKDNLLNSNFTNNCFDAISCLNIFEHIDDDYRAAQELYRITNKNGKIFATVPANPNLFDMYDELHCHVRRYNLQRFNDIFIKAGFKIIKASYFGFFLYPPFYIIKKLNQFKYSSLSIKEKKEIMLNEIQNTQNNSFANLICKFERTLNKYVSYPCGIRVYVSAVKN